MNRAFTTNQPFLPDLSTSTNFMVNNAFCGLKPVMRRNCLHNRNNIFITWKSFEIQICKLEYAASTTDTQKSKLLAQKFLNPVYVPVAELRHLLQQPTTQMEHSVMRCLKLTPNGKQFNYVAPMEAP